MPRARIDEMDDDGDRSRPFQPPPEKDSARRRDCVECTRSAPGWESPTRSSTNRARRSASAPRTETECGENQEIARAHDPHNASDHPIVIASRGRA